MFHNQNNNKYIENDNNIVVSADIQLFLEDDDDDKDQQHEQQHIRHNQCKIDRLIERLLAVFIIQRIIDCIIFIADQFVW